ncbi:hypothetical protein KNO81_41750 [Paraburkholderia sediminicola]|nr:hypothetical protein [Paraburkholderia sediminicola]
MLNITQILSAAAVGAIGVLIGGVALFLVKKLYRKDLSPRIAMIFFLAPIIAGQVIHREILVPIINQAEAVAILDGDPLFTALKKYDHAMYESFVGRVKEGTRLKNGKEFFTNLGGEVGQAITSKHLPKASNEALREYVLANVAAMTELNQQSADSCFAIATGQKVDVSKIMKMLSASTKSMMENAMIGILASSGAASKSLMTEEQMAATVRPVISSLQARYGNRVEVLAKIFPPSRGVSKSDACELAAAFFAEVGKLPPEQLGPLVRKMAAGQ